MRAKARSDAAGCVTRRWSRLAATVAVLAAALICCHGAVAGDDARENARIERSLIAQHAAVVSDSGAASRVGAEALSAGGNAVDAAVATAFALAVTFPEAGNIGGGGFMLIVPPEGEPAFVDYRETAPAAATPELFDPDESRFTHKYVGVPGTVRGLALAHERYGTRPWRDLVAPAIVLAEEGFSIDARLAGSLNVLLAEWADRDELRRVFGKPDGTSWQAGDRLVQKELARTLRAIAHDGPDAFYRGRIAEAIAAEMRSGGGLLTLADLAAYEAKLRTPVHGTFHGYDIYGAPPPSSGGIATIQTLNILENFDLAAEDRWSPRNVLLTVEALRRAFRDRAMHLGDGDFTAIPQHLTDKRYAAELAAGIDPDRATPSEVLAGEIALAPEGTETTHFSVLDATGMAVANTYTLEQSYGARVVVRGAGFLLNNEMGDFNARPGLTDRAGRIGTPANVVAPGKRMLSSMAPTIVLRDGRVVLITGSPGGRTIISTVVCVLLNRLAYDLSPEELIAAPRLHHGWFPDRVLFEGAGQPEFAQLVEQLRALGHVVADEPHVQGAANSIFLEPNGAIHAIGDARRGGTAAGW